MMSIESSVITAADHKSGDLGEDLRLLRKVNRRAKGQVHMIGQVTQPRKVYPVYLQYSSGVHSVQAVHSHWPKVYRGASMPRFLDRLSVVNFSKKGTHTFFSYKSNPTFGSQPHSSIDLLRP